VGKTLSTSADVEPQGSDWPEVNPADNTASDSVPVLYNASVLNDNFDDPTLDPHWSDGTPVKTPTDVTYLSGFGGSDSVRLNLADLGPHQRVIVSFDLYVIGPWDGMTTPSRWIFGETGQAPLLDTSFCGSASCQQAYPNGTNPGGTGAAGQNELGLVGTGDYRYHLSYTWNQTDSTLGLTFASLGLPAGAKWGLDNVSVKLDSGVRFTYLPLATR
jgi:hypothetical protein